MARHAPLYVAGCSTNSQYHRELMRYSGAGWVFSIAPGAGIERASILIRRQQALWDGPGTGRVDIGFHR
jgi:hypothetical protein